MKEDDEGFRYPEVDVEVCIECGLCEAVCPILHKPIKEHRKTIGYVIQHKDNNIRRDSTSEGIFSAISDYVLNQNGYVLVLFIIKRWRWYIMELIRKKKFNYLEARSMYRVK